MSLEVSRRHLKELGIRGGLTNALIADRALAREIEVRPDSQGRLSMQVGGRVRWFNGAKTNLNSILARRCVQNKDVTARLLRSYGVQAPENLVFSVDQLRSAWMWAERLVPVVVKPPNGGLGRSVHLSLRSFSEFEEAFETVAEESGAVLVERFVCGMEHRVLMIYGKVAAAARRTPANVTGNGSDSVAALIEEKNRARRAAQNPVHWELPVDALTIRELAGAGMTLESVPGEGERVWLRSNSNVHSGGDGVDATDELRPDEIALAERTIRAIPGLKLAGLDMLLPRDGANREPCVLEVNAFPMITGHHYPWLGEGRDVAGMLVDAMFPKSAAAPSSGTGSAPLVGAGMPSTQQKGLLARWMARIGPRRRS